MMYFERKDILANLMTKTLIKEKYNMINEKVGLIVS